MLWNIQNETLRVLPRVLDIWLAVPRKTMSSLLRYLDKTSRKLRAFRKCHIEPRFLSCKSFHLSKLYNILLTSSHK